MKERLLLAAALVLLLMVHPTFAKAEDWYFKPSKNNQPATTEPEYEALLKKYNGVYIGDTSKKIIYLTFDNGYEAGYTNKILDTLKAKHVPAAFIIKNNKKALSII